MKTVLLVLVVFHLHVAGIALLGTNLLRTHRKTTANYDRVFVALDKDATDKGTSHGANAPHFLPANASVVLDTDLKNMMDDERDEYFDPISLETTGTRVFT